MFMFKQDEMEHCLMFMSIFYKGKTGPYIYYIAKIAYLLNIEHEIEVHDTKSNKEV